MQLTVNHCPSAMACEQCSLNADVPVQFSWGPPGSKSCCVLTKLGSVLLGRIHGPLVRLEIPGQITAAALNPMMPQLAYACGSEVHLMRQEDGSEMFSVSVPCEAAQEAEAQGCISCLKWLGPRSLLAGGVIINEVYHLC